jgi:preprotein translocase subunit SecE
MADKLKLAIAVLILGAGVVAFYHFSDHSTLLRVLGLLAATGVAIFVALQTQSGVELAGYGRGAVIEVRKVVWPSRRETFQTTAVVLTMVLIMGLIMWGFDSLLAWIIRTLTS